MSDNDESLRDCLIACIAQRYQREFGTPDRDIYAELDALTQRLAALEQIAAEGYDSWFEANREKIGL